MLPNFLKALDDANVYLLGDLEGTTLRLAAVDIAEYWDPNYPEPVFACRVLDLRAISLSGISESETWLRRGIYLDEILYEARTQRLCLLKDTDPPEQQAIRCEIQLWYDNPGKYCEFYIANPVSGDAISAEVAKRSADNRLHWVNI